MLQIANFQIDEIIKTALNEDINYIDVTTDLLFPEEHQSQARILAKTDGVLAGIEVAKRVFTVIDSHVGFKGLFKDGQSFKKGDVIIEIEGGTSVMLKAERTTLNFLQHMSGIATYTKLCVDAVSGTGAVVSDTRKTLPGLRALQKYAVLCGGGSNHRFNLSQAAMIKDNHIDAYGSVTNAVKALRERVGHTIMTEVEVRDLEQLRHAIEADADLIMLDNMDNTQMREAVRVKELLKSRAKLEASGNVTLENIREIALTGVDIISVGALTHSVKASDLSMMWIK